MEDTATEIKDLVFSENEEKESVESTGGLLNNLVSNPKEEEEEGGVVNNFISSVISPKCSPRLRGNMDSKEKGDDLGFKEESGEDLGGGFFKNLVSTIFRQSEENEKVEEKHGVIDSLVSHLTTPHADDAVPATDEASILIHSIVHD